MSATVQNTTFVYEILNFIAYPTYETYQNVVFSIMWKYTGTYTDPDSKVWTYSQQFVTSIPVGTITNFIPFDQLTFDITVQWINGIVNINQTQQNFVDYINRQISPPPPSVVVLQPPF